MPLLACPAVKHPRPNCLAALLDKVLLVVEAEKDTWERVKRGYRELVAARSDVSVVLNKTRKYGPDWIEDPS